MSAVHIIVLFSAGLISALVAVAAPLRTRGRRLASGLVAALLIMSACAALVVQWPSSSTGSNNRPAPVSPSLSLFFSKPTGAESVIVGALHAADGSLRWQRQIASLPPVGVTVAGGVAFVPGDLPPAPVPQPPTVTALRASDGAQLWSVSLEVSAHKSTQPGSVTVRPGPISAPPVVADGNVYMVLDVRQYVPGTRAIVALRASDGHQLWWRQVDHYDGSQTDQPIAAVAGFVFVAGSGALQARDSTLAWT